MVYGKIEKERQRRYREKHREELRERDRRRYKENPNFYRQKTILYNKRHRNIILERKRQTYEDIKSKGICVNCKKERDNTKSKCLCSLCLNKIKNKNCLHQRKKRENFKKMGVCRHCGNKLIKGSKYYCKKCIEYNREKGRIYINSSKGKFQRKLNHQIAKYKALQIIS